MHHVLKLLPQARYNVLFLALLLIANLPAHAQISAGGTPPSFSLSLSSAVPTVDMPPVDNSTLREQAEANEARAVAEGESIPYFFAHIHDVHLDLANSGHWETLPDGSRLWRLRVESPGALTLHFIYDRWWLPKGATLFVYNDDRSQLIGAFTANNNWNVDSTNVTAPLSGDAVTLEYHVPADVADDGLLSIGKVFHAFRAPTPANPLDGFGDSGPCQVDVNCPEGQPWQLEKRSVVLLFMPNGGSCSGALINNSTGNGRPYVLTANHCDPSGSGGNWVARFNYESPFCGPQDGPYNQTLTNATVRARWDVTDFLLIEFQSPPPLSYNPYFAGWDRSGNGGANTFGIHHPAADIKKISVDNQGPYITDWNGNYNGYYWGVHWDVGRTQPGSSGSPLFNHVGLIVGQLRGGMSLCPAEDEPEKYGRFYYSYYGYQGAPPSARLHEWLNPNGGAGDIWPGQPPIVPPNDECANATNIPSLPYLHTGYTWYADPEFLNCTNQSSPQVWYRLPPAGCPRQITVNLCGSTFDTQIQVFRGACGSLVGVGCNDDGPTCANGDPLQGQFTFTAEQNQPYMFVVSGWMGASGLYSIQVTGTQLTPVNDSDCDAVVINSLPFSYSGNTGCATDAYSNSCNVGSNAPDVEFELRLPCNAQVTLSTCGSDFDTILELREAPQSFPFCENAIGIVACNDDFCGLQSQVTYNILANYGYRIIVDGYGGATGNYVLNVTGSLSGDVCPGITIPSLPYATSNNTGCGTDGAPAACNSDFSPDLVYNYTPTTCHMMSVDLCGNTWDTQIKVFTGACPGTIPVACNDDFCGLQSRVVFPVQAGLTYYIYIDGFYINYGPYSVYMDNTGAATPPGDVCSTAPFISALPYSAVGNTSCAVNNYTNCVGTTSREVVYRLMLPVCTDVTVSLCGSNYDTGLGVYGGVCPNIAPLIVCNDDNYCGDVYTLQSTVTFTAEANTNYQILVHGYAANSGLYALNVTGTPCPTTPPAVADQIVQFDLESGNVSISWTATEGADRYYVYRSSDYNTLFEPQNIIANTTGTSFVCEGCIHNPAIRSFFGVLAENEAGPMALEPPRDFAGLGKADAVQGPVTVSVGDFYPVESEEHAPAGKQPDSATRPLQPPVGQSISSEGHEAHQQTGYPAVGKGQ